MEWHPDTTTPFLYIMFFDGDIEISLVKNFDGAL